MANLRPFLESFKFLDVSDVLAASSICQLWHQVAENEELWCFLLHSRTEDLLLEATLHLYPTSKSLYRAVLTQPFIPVIVHSNYVKYRILPQTLEKCVLSGPSPEITKASYMLFLPDMSLFVCGGDMHSEEYYDYGLKAAYRILPETNEVIRLKDMREARRYACGVYYAGVVYVFGGSDYDTYLNSAEQFHISANEWSELPPMLDRRNSFTACRHLQLIYLIGGSKTTKCETFNIPKQTYQPLPLTLSGAVDCVSAVVGDELIAFTMQEAIRWHIPTGQELSRVDIDSHSYVWSNGQPLVHNTEVWFYYWHKEMIISYNTTTRHFSHGFRLPWSLLSSANFASRH